MCFDFNFCDHDFDSALLRYLEQLGFKRIKSVLDGLPHSNSRVVSNMKTPNANQSTAYRKFITARDRALEKLLNDSQKKIALILHDFLEWTHATVGSQYLRLSQDHFFTRYSREMVSRIEISLNRKIEETAFQILTEIHKLRSMTYQLTVGAEGEAIARAIGKPTKIVLPKVKLKQYVFSDWSGGETPINRIMLSLNRIRRDVVDAVELSVVMGEAPLEMLSRVEKAFPKSVSFKKPPTELKRLKEAAKGPKVPMGTEFMDHQEWEEIADAYLERLPTAGTRFFNLEKGADEDGEMRYNWEIEQRLTDEWVRDVRNGQVEAANQNDIQDFVWIAVIDNVTDECCLWRDGLTTSEIEGQLSKSDDECDAIVPPAHFNCRCTLAPVGEVTDKVEPNLQEFDEWLNS